MCQPCHKRKDWSRGCISHNKIEIKGICHLLTARQMAINNHQHSAHDQQVAMILLNPPRWTSPTERMPVVPFSAGPANKSNMLVDLNGGWKSWSKRCQNDILKTIADATQWWCLRQGEYQ